MEPVRVLLFAVLASFPAWACSAQLLVLNKSDATLAFIDPASGATSATIKTGDGPHEIELSSDGRLAFVSGARAGSPPA